MCKVFHSSESSLVIDVKSNQHLDPLLMEFKDSVLNKNNKSFSYGKYGVLRYQRRLCVPDVDGLRDKIMDKAHGYRYSIHRGATKMYHDLRDIYWMNGMKRKVDKFVSRCPNCQQVKAKHQNPGGLTQDIDM